LEEQNASQTQSLFVACLSGQVADWGSFEKEKLEGG